MPRTARETSHTGVYHAILRGVNKQQIFECTEDYEHFVRILQRQCGLPVNTRPTQIGNDNEIPSERHCYLYAWCLMGNHVHLLIKENDEPLGETMKRISSSYVYYYNHKYERVGHLFQERFKSQPVNDWQYFLTLLRYIHQNPLKPHLVQDLKDYPWSSWLEYTENFTPSFTSTKTVLDRITLSELTELINDILTDEEDQEFLDVEVRTNRQLNTDESIWREIQYLCGVTNSTQFQALPRPQQKHILYTLHELGAGPRTLSRLTGVSYSVVWRSTKGAKEAPQPPSPYSVCESDPFDEEFYTYCDEGYFQQYPEY